MSEKYNDPEIVKDLIKKKEALDKNLGGDNPVAKKDLTQEEAGLDSDQIDKALQRAKEAQQKQQEKMGVKPEPKQTDFNEIKNEKLFGKDIFKEKFELKIDTTPKSVFVFPSKGIAYENEKTLQNLESIPVYAMTGFDEETLLSLRSSNDVMESFYDFINSKIAYEGFDCKKLIPEDFFPLLYFIRLFSNQDEPSARLFSFSSFCPKCKARNDFENVDLADMEIVEYNGFEYPYPVKLKNETVYLKYIPIEKEKIISQAVDYDKENEILKKHNIDTTRIREYQFRTVKIIGKEGELLPVEDWFNFYLNMNTSDKRKINEAVGYMGKVGSVEHSAICKSCSRRSSFRVPITPTIFYS